MRTHMSVSREENRGTCLKSPDNMKHVCICCDDEVSQVSAEVSSNSHHPSESDKSKHTHVFLLPFSYRPRPKDVFRGNIDNPEPTHIEVWLCPEHKRKVEESTCEGRWSGWDWWDVVDGIYHLSSGSI